jgi:hypothetical protein
MAIGAGSVVALNNSSAALAAGAVSVIWQSPMFGVVDSGGGPYVVNWGDGEQQTVVAGALDEIVSASNTDLIGHIVSLANENGSARITVVAEYRRGGSGGVDVVLGQTQSGAWRELPVSAVQQVS